MRRIDRRHVMGLAALCGAGALATFPAHQMFRRSAIAFGTQVSITLVGASEATLAPAFAASFRAIRAVESAANLFNPASEIARLNQCGVLEAPSEVFLALIRFALGLAEASGGAFDPTIQPVWQAWRAAKTHGREPEAETLARALALVDYRGVQVQPGRIRLAHAGMGLSLNALAQGHATDLVMAAVQAEGVPHAFIDTGELGARGMRPGGAPWCIGVASPREADRMVAQTALASRRFAATSADNATTWRSDFSEHHIVEPWSGRSPRALASVCVIADSGMLADGLSTAAMVLGQVRARALMAKIAPGSSVLFITKDGQLSALGEEFRRST